MLSTLSALSKRLYVRFLFAIGLWPLSLDCILYLGYPLHASGWDLGDRIVDVPDAAKLPELGADTIGLDFEPILLSNQRTDSETDTYEEESPLGYQPSRVYLVHTTDGEPRVLKIAAGITDSGDSFFLRECCAYARFLHHQTTCVPHCYGLIKLNTCCPHSDALGISLPTEALLLEYIPDASPVSEPTLTFSVMVQALDGLDEIHRAFVCHDDIAERNLLVTKDTNGRGPRAVWIDFDRAHTAPFSRLVSVNVLSRELRIAWGLLRNLFNEGVEDRRMAIGEKARMILPSSMMGKRRGEIPTLGIDFLKSTLFLILRYPTLAHSQYFTNQAANLDSLVSSDAIASLFVIQIKDVQCTSPTTLRPGSPA